MPGNSNEEDAACHRMGMIGAKLWPSEEDSYKPLPRGIREGKIGEQQLWLGWLKRGGVWALSIDSEIGVVRGIGMIHNAFNMEKRCLVLERMGGIFYMDPNDCQDTKDSVPSYSFLHMDEHRSLAKPSDRQQEPCP